jgi:hypothetical protein
MKRDDKDFITQILKQPFQSPEFHPLPREEIYDRQSGGRKTSPLDVEGVDLSVSAEEIVEFIADGRRESHK